MNTVLRIIVLCSLASLFFTLAESQSRRWNYDRRYNGHYPFVHERGRLRASRGRSRRMGTVLRGAHVCHQQGSSFCCPGWKIGADRGCSQPICEEGSCGENGICRKPNMCLCSDGRMRRICPSDETGDMGCRMRCNNGGQCVDNECVCTYGYTGPHCEQPICGAGCLNGGRCTAPGRCACVYGFTGFRCERDYRKGPCFMTRTNTTCINEVAGVMCTKLLCCATIGQGWGHPCEECPARVGNCSKGRLPPHCTDINECEILPGVCEGGECINTDGSFTCGCPEGYEHDETTHRCVDTDECKTQDVCSGGTCVNNDGGFLCECPSDTRISADGTYCITDVPGRCYTAIESGMCAGPLGHLITKSMCCCIRSGRETMGKCFAAIGQFPERCASIGSPEYEHDCSGTTPGSYDICRILGENYCAHGACVENSETNDYFCSCDEGYQPSEDGKRCLDVDECATSQTNSRGICGSHGTCLNTDGAFTCHCKPGFENPPDNPTICVDINECDYEDTRDLCENGRCVNTKGSFICKCDDGYRSTATQQRCIDINECEEIEGLCLNGRCLNLRGDYRCICNPGYFLTSQQKECVDTNECERDNMCANGRCQNMNGMYKCICNPGFRVLPNGQSCVDIDECGTNPCMNGRCRNTIGSYICICHEFQVLDETGTRCILNQQLAQCYRNVRNGQCRAQAALTRSTTRADCCCSVPGAISAWGDTCEPCPERTAADYAVLCHDYEIPNVCDFLQNACENGHCINMGENRYRCECNKGFLVSSDQTSCKDIDECDQNLCSNGECRNTPGSYSCICNDGYLLNGDVCEDIDECLSSPCTNGACINMPGRYRCVCEDGSQLDVTGHICYDVRQGRCWAHYEHGVCMDSVGSELMTAEACCNSVGVAWGSMGCTPCSEFEFACPKGYKFDVSRNSCVNIIECEYNVCKDNANCIDTNGSFICVCPPGFVLHGDGRSCVDLRVGTCYLGLNRGGGCDGDNSIGSSLMRRRDCCCSIGKAWGDDCEICPELGSTRYNQDCRDLNNGGERNECIMFPNICMHGECKNTDSSYVCQCNHGFTLDESGNNCTDIDECLISPGLCAAGECINIAGDFECDCNEGFKVSLASKICVDINECTEEAHCRGGECINTQGSYMCRCPDGRSISEDGGDCIDIDECALRPDLCSPNGRCENMLGYYMCLCDRGYQRTEDAQDCIDVDECDTGNGGCQMGCTNTIGSYECTCDDGFVLSFDGHTCADKDECMEQMNRCNGGRCENRVGTFICICFDGFMSSDDLQFCEDIDECAMNENVCMNGRCHNTRGSYTCSCDVGYCVPRGQMICVDENECELSKHNCHVNADCNNTDGSYTCSCIQGFNGDGFMCHDDNECELGTHMCHEFATCSNKLGGYDCECDDGYHGDGFSCTDVDDCIQETSLCGDHGLCVNSDGSFQCECEMGFVNTSDGKACKDIDECAFEAICFKGRCHNVPGSFICSCLDGYEKDERGANCTDIDECLDIANCINGICVNTIGNYECQCPEGFFPNPSGVGCVDNRVGDCFLHSEGDENAPICVDPIGVGVTKASCCCSGVSGWGDPCELCPSPNTTEYDTLCPGGLGFIPNPITILLEDIDECRNLPGLCQGGRCINVFGSYMCDCNVGYQLNQETRACEDVNECELESGSVCGVGVCKNTVGGYNCVCPEGYISVQGGRKCKDIRTRSCYRYYNESSSECSSEVFEQTKRGCCCFENVGQGWNSPCERCPDEDTDEFIDLCGSTGYIPGPDVCIVNTDLCRNGICVATGEGYVCECPAGYHYNDELLFCEDDDECENEDNCFLNSQCVNQPGSYRCACLDGYGFISDSEDCQDIDECENPTTCVNGECRNSQGGFECECNQGFRRVNDGKACEDINECEREPCGNGVCQNVFGSFTCTCDTGFRISDNGDCVDVNECEEAEQCGHGTCLNQDGDFACDCDEGYTPTADGRDCIDVNECLLDATTCGAGTCQNMDGSFKCYCPDGYSNEDEKSCVDVDECGDDFEYCAFGRCENTPGSFVCHCPPRHVLTSNMKHCVDTRRGNCYADYEDGVCSGSSSISLTRGGCCCQCISEGWGFGETNCTSCPRNGTDEFSALCPYGCGTTPGGIDIDECRQNPCTNGQCMNMAGSFKCICNTGFELDDTDINCVDINECVRSDVCGAGVCTNTEGSFECECESGFYNGPSITCLDIDECRDSSINHCGFRCENSVGSFRCACPQGFQLRGDGRMCEDVNECESDSLNDCTAKGMTCENVIGYYSCLCPSGYRRIGTTDTCVDVNECEQLRVCTNGVCVNQEGSYTCRCQDGYDFDEEHKLCLDNRQGLCYAATHQRMCEITSTTGLPFTKAECCCNNGKGWGDDCEECPHPGTEEFLLLCPHGSGYKPNGEDIDDCNVIPGLCRHGTCINTLGSYRCACDQGYEPSISRKACVDLNECLASPSPCSFDCRNTEGSFECVCPQGYTSDQRGSQCVDMDECSTKRHNCQYVCQNTVGSFKCQCPHGFVQEGTQCVDKNECADTPGICGARGMCRNEPGGYRCECPRGFRQGAGSDACVDVDECSRTQSPCGGGCRNLMGSFRCSCGDGYVPNLYGKGCADVNECYHNPCGLGQTCSNTRGSFECGCSRGLAKMGSGCGDVDECQMGGGSCQFSCQNTYGGFSCMCPNGYFRIGSGHCVRGNRGFQQRVPHIPSYRGYGMPPPPRQSYGNPREDTVCFSCMPGGDVRRRQRRSTDESEGRFIEVSDHDGRATVNTSYPIEILIPNRDMTSHFEILSLRASLKQLRDNVHYEIVSGNDHHRFRIRHHGQNNIIHFTKRAIDADRSVVTGPRETTLHLRAATTLNREDIPRASFDSETIQAAIEETVEFDVKITLDD